MKEVLIISFWNPTKKTPGKGVFIHDQVRALFSIRKGITFLEVNILPGKTIFRKEILEKELSGNRTITINICSFFWKGIYLNPWLVYFLLRRYLKRYQLNPALIHSNVVFPCAVVGGFFAKRYTAPHIISEHWSNAVKIAKHPLFGKIVLKTYRNSKYVLCVSEYLAGKIRSIAPGSRIKIVPNIIDTGLFLFNPEQKWNEVLTFVCVATWKKPKRLDLIIHSLEAFAQEERRQIHLAVIGEGDQKSEFEQNFHHDYLSIEWHGYLPKTDIAQVLHQSDFFLHASETETFSIVTVEALASGLPVVASKTGAIPELIHEHNGFLVENTVEAWKNGIRQILEKNFDRSDISRSVADKFSPSSVAKKIEQVYEDLFTDSSIN